MILVNTTTSNGIKKYFSKLKTLSNQFVVTIINSRENEVQHRYRLWLDHFNSLYGNVWDKIINQEQNVYINANNPCSKYEIQSKHLFGLYTSILITCKLYLLLKIKVSHEKNSNKNVMIKLQMVKSDPRLILEEFESGQLFFDLFCIKNFPFDTLFNWYLYCWNELEGTITDISLTIQDIITLERNEAIFFKDLYENVIPQNIRRLLGEFYTPLWLIDYMLLQLDNFNTETILDPCCGTGGFLSRIITRYCNSLKRDNYNTDPGSILEIILTHIYGFDINPVSIIMSKIMYILSLIENLNVECLELRKPAEIPVFEKNVFTQESGIDTFDLIIGNPPWIKYDTLTVDYRKNLVNKYLSDYQLFSFNGMKAGLGYAQDDLSTTFLIITAEKFLKRNGVIFFIIKQSLFKSEAGKDFRKFSIQKKDQKIIHLKVEQVWDLRAIWPFKTGQKVVGAETALVKLRKDQKTHYPVPYWKVTIKTGNKLDPNSTVDHVLRVIETKKLLAIPDPVRTHEGILAPWVFSDNNKHILPTFDDTHYYKARHGVVNDFIGVFHVIIQDNCLDTGSSAYNNNEILIRPSNKGKTRIPEELDMWYTIEQKYLFPIIKSKNIKRWNIIGHEYMLIPYNVFAEKDFEKTFSLSKTYKYLQTFRSQLLNRKSRWFRNRPFYSLFGIGPYTFSPYKVVWVCIGKPSRQRFVVVSSISERSLGIVKKILIPDNPIGFVPLYDEDTAYYLCGVLNSQLAEMYLQNRISEGKWSVSIYHISNFPFRKFNPENALHRKIVEVAKKLHELTKNSEKIILVDEQEQLLNSYVNELYSNPDKNMRKSNKSLKNLMHKS